MQSKQDARQIGGPSKWTAWQTMGNGRRRRLLAFYGAIAKRTVEPLELHKSQVDRHLRNQPKTG